MKENICWNDGDACHLNGVDANSMMESVTYDADGNVVTRRTLKYNGSGRLVEEVICNGDGQPTRTLRFRYDRDGADLLEGSGHDERVNRWVFEEHGQLMGGETAVDADGFYVVDPQAASGAIRYSGVGLPHALPDAPPGKSTNEASWYSGEAYNYVGYLPDVNVGLFITQAGWVAETVEHLGLQTTRPTTQERTVGLPAPR